MTDKKMGLTISVQILALPFIYRMIMEKYFISQFLSVLTNNNNNNNSIIVVIIR